MLTWTSVDKRIIESAAPDPSPVALILPRTLEPCNAAPNDRIVDVGGRIRRTRSVWWGVGGRAGENFNGLPGWDRLWRPHLDRVLIRLFGFDLNLSLWPALRSAPVE